MSSLLARLPAGIFLDLKPILLKSLIPSPLFYRNVLVIFQRLHLLQLVRCLLLLVACLSLAQALLLTLVLLALLLPISTLALPSAFVIWLADLPYLILQLSQALLLLLREHYL